MMFIVALGVVLTAMLLASAAYRRGPNGTDMGSVSYQWLAAYRASEPASSQ